MATNPESRRHVFHRLAIHLAIRLAILLAVILCAPAASPAQTATPVTVPFVGCRSDGQVGALKAPHGSPKSVRIPAAIAQQLAFYKAAYGVGVLAPRGWFCFGVYGSSGEALYVSPTPLSSATVLSTAWKGFSGPAIQLSVDIGDTSGRFEVASIINRVFPGHKKFADDVITDGLQSRSYFPTGPYPKDKLIYKGADIVEYQTPAHTEGLGTRSRLQQNGDPIRGVVILYGPDTDLIHLSQRLPANLTSLSATIVQQVERDLAGPQHD
ncbi:MAG TPA: hypothetical protein VFE06_15415 [Acidobacteriaceae bacterium]|nr:hypothetical protein [Acidobacteriaceae bacterium]